MSFHCGKKEKSRICTVHVDVFVHVSYQQSTLVVHGCLIYICPFLRSFQWLILFRGLYNRSFLGDNGGVGHASLPCPFHAYFVCLTGGMEPKPSPYS